MYRRWRAVGSGKWLARFPSHVMCSTVHVVFRKCLSNFISNANVLYAMEEHMLVLFQNEVWEEIRELKRDVLQEAGENNITRSFITISMIKWRMEDRWNTQHAWKRWEVYMKLKLDRLKGRDHLENLGVDDGTVCRHILRNKLIFWKRLL